MGIPQAASNSTTSNPVPFVSITDDHNRLYGSPDASNYNVHLVSWPWRYKGLKQPHFKRKKNLRNKNVNHHRSIVEKSEQFFKKWRLKSMSSIKYVSQSDHILCSKRPITFLVNPRALWETLGKKNVQVSVCKSCHSEREGKYAATTSWKEIRSINQRTKSSL